MNNFLGIINLDEREDKISELTATRPLASVPFAGRYRIIDFILSNMTNAGITSIGIFAKNDSRSLVDHLSNGRPWDLHRKIDGLRFFNFAQKSPVNNDIRMFADNLDFLKYAKQEYIILAPSYMICNIDFQMAAAYHESTEADVTMIYKKVNNANDHFYGCDLLNIDEENKVVSVGENIGTTKTATIGMEMFLMKKDFFIGLIYECVKTGKWQKIKQCIYSNLNKYYVNAYEFDGYLACINSLASYYSANMELLNTRVNNELFFDNGPIYTKSKDEAPTKYSEESKVRNSIVANGCYIEGTVENCIVSRRVKINKGAVIKDSIIFQNTIIGPNASLTNVITDKFSYISKGESLRGAKSYPVVIQKQKVI